MEGANTAVPAENGTKRSHEPELDHEPETKKVKVDSSTVKPTVVEDSNQAAHVEEIAEKSQPEGNEVKVTSESTQNNDASKVAPEATDVNIDARSLPRGTAPIKPEYLIPVPNRADDAEIDDDAAEAKTTDPRDRGRDGGGKGRDGGKKKKQRGQNEKRDFGRSIDAKGLCSSRAFTNEFSPAECKFERCNFLHDLREYFATGRRQDLETFDGKCPVYETIGECPMGWKCLFVKSHSTETTHADGRKELVLLTNPGKQKSKAEGHVDKGESNLPGVINAVSAERKAQLNRRKYDLSRSEKYVEWLDKDTGLMRKIFNSRKDDQATKTQEEKLQEYRAEFVDPPFKPSEKRRIYFGRETPVLAPLTTQGNLPFRRLCVELGAGATYSEMAVGMHLIQGQKSEWALLKAHESEATPPRFENPATAAPGYDNSRDLKFGAQIASNQPYIAVKTVQALTENIPHLRLVDLNCGCPIDMVFKQGAGSALLDAPAKLEKMIRGMNAVSGEVPITCKLRLGVKDGRPTAQRTIERLAFGASDAGNVLGAPGCAAITLHGRSRQQRYKNLADWGYIAECATMIKDYKATAAALTDTVREPDAGTLANGGRMFFLGNGDCYSHLDYFSHIDDARVDSVMIARGALIKPWIFEEIEKGQYLDKSASERLAYIEKFARYGIESWGSDEIGIGNTRRFLLEYLSFTHRYIPLGLLEHLPPRINDRPPAFRGRDDLETLLASNNYKDWIKISEMFLGPAPGGFKFAPKHKSNSYEVEAEG
ncbi:unnamed protein product [Discula destructiva]